MKKAKAGRTEKSCLQHERTNIAGVANSQYRLGKLKDAAAKPIHGAEPLLQNDSFKRKIAKLEIELKALEYTELRTLASVKVGQSPGPESSFLKIRGTELQQAMDALMVEAAGYYALPYVPTQYDLDFPETKELARC